MSVKMKRQKVKMTLVRTDGGTQMRVEVDKALVTSYTEDLKNKAEFPPVDLFYDGKVYWLADETVWCGEPNGISNAARTV